MRKTALLHGARLTDEAVPWALACVAEATQSMGQGTKRFRRPRTGSPLVGGRAAHGIAGPALRSRANNGVLHPPRSWLVMFEAISG